MSKASEVELPPSESLLRALDINFRITRYLIENIPSEAWSAEPAGGKGRTIAAITAHIHNVRRMWLKVPSGKPVPGRGRPTHADSTQRSRGPRCQCLRGPRDGRRVACLRQAH